MKTKDFAKLGKSILPGLPDFAVEGALLFIAPVGSVLRGFCFEGSSFSKDVFFVNAFFLPMYIPRNHLSFTFGDRLRNGTTDIWETTDQNFLEDLRRSTMEVASYLHTLADIEAIIAEIRKRIERPNPHVHEAYAYSLIKAGRAAEAYSAIDVLLTLIKPDVPWQRELQQRAMLIRSLLDESAHQALEQLTVWENHTLRSLKLEKYR
jgi:hypothetical protein